MNEFSIQLFVHPHQGKRLRIRRLNIPSTEPKVPFNPYAYLEC